MLLAAASPEAAGVFIELGLIIVALAIVARVATSFGFSPIPLYLLAGLVVGVAFPLSFSEEFIEVGAEIGVILLLFMLGLEYTGEELRDNLRVGLPAGGLDIALNFTPGLAAGFLLGWSPVAALLLGGVTYISSSGVISKVLSDLGRLGNRETPSILSLLVIEDLVMAAYLPLVAVLLLGVGLAAGLASLVVAVATAGAVLVIAIRYGEPMSRLLANRSDEVVLLSTFGLVVLVAGVAERLQVSAAVGAFLVGIALSGPVADHARELLSPLRDLFAATFFVFFGLQIDSAAIPDVAVLAVGLALVTGLTKLFTGWWAARRAGVGERGRFRAGGALIARGEFSIVIAGLGVTAGIEPQLGPLAAAYVLLMAFAGPIVTRSIDGWVLARRRRRAGTTAGA
ncbi:MAG TPA: cation:proton antiporter [Egibacteraceae bacterium]|nr:cation:proton antiporter [Egibacteraceae bacterium]